MLAIALLKLTGRVWLAAEYVTTVMFGMVSWMVYVNNGIMSTSIIWYACTPVAAVFVSGRRAGYVWSDAFHLCRHWFYFCWRTISPAGCRPRRFRPRALPGLQPNR